MKKSKTIVTDHAVIRYLERGLGVNVEGLRRRIGKRADIAQRHGADSVTIDGVTYKLRDGHCTTVVDSLKRRRRRRRAR